MKNFVVYFWTIMLSISITLSQNSIGNNKFNRESDPEYHKGRKEWLKSIHKSEPGVNYKILKNELKKERLSRQINSKTKLKNDDPKLQKFISDNGKIIGSWKERGSRNLSGRMLTTDVDLKEGLIYAASHGGNVWRGTLDGEDWKCLNTSIQFDIKNIKVEDFGSYRRIIVFDNSNVYVSDNEGEWWYPATGLEEIAKWGWIEKGVVLNNDSKRIIYVLANEWDYTDWKHIKSIYYSIDNGLNFHKILSVNNTDNIDIWGWESSIGEYIDKSLKPVNYDKLIYLHNDTIFSINSNVVNVLNINNEILSLIPNNIRLSGSIVNENIMLYVNVTNPINNLINTFRTSDFGLNLEYMSQSPTNYFMRNSFGVSKLNEDLAFIGGVDCFKTINGGLSWVAINGWAEYYQDPINKLHADIPGIKSFRTEVDKEFFLICTDGGIYKTDEKYLVKNISLQDLNVSQYYSIYSYDDISDQVIIAGSQDQGFQRSEFVSDKVLDFEQIISGDYGSLTSGDNGKSMWSVYPGFAMFNKNVISNNNIVSWDFPNSSNDRTWIPPIVAVPGNPYIAYIAPGGSVPAKSKIWILTYNENTKEIEPFEAPFQFDSQDPENDVTSLGVSEIDINYVYALTRTGKFYSSTDGGMTWLETPEFIGPGYNYLHGACIYPSKTKLGRVYITGSGYSNPGIFVTEDNGQTFLPIEGLPPTFVYQIEMTKDEEVIFAATDNGPYIYIKNHNKWYNIAGFEAPDQSYWSVNYLEDKNIVRFATYGRGIWDFEIENIITSVNDEINESHNELSVFPNPVQNFININFKGNIGNKILIKIIDLEGKLIHKVFDGVLNSEDNNLSVNIEEINHLVSGTYLVIMVSNDMLKYQKIVISK